MIEEVIRSDAPRARDGRWLARDGTALDVEWSCTPLPMIETGPLYLVSATDITERKRHEEEVRRSRARIVAAADEARKRLERNLHDGAQQRLIALLLSLRFANANTDDGALRLVVASAIEELAAAVSELRELARGIHPSSLTHAGLAVAVRAAAERAPVPVEVDIPGDRYPQPVEAAAYYIVSEALANVARYAKASSVFVRVREEGDQLVVVIQDDGVGGADSSLGTGLRGLSDRAAALDGRFTVHSPAGGGTQICAEIPLRA
jgi:signal transduction histidine kinase